MAVLAGRVAGLLYVGDAAGGGAAITERSTRSLMLLCQLQVVSRKACSTLTRLCEMGLCCATLRTPWASLASSACSESPGPRHLDCQTFARHSSTFWVVSVGINAFADAVWASCRALRQLPSISTTYLKSVEAFACGEQHAVLGLLETCHMWYDNVAPRDGSGVATVCNTCLRERSCLGSATHASHLNSTPTLEATNLWNPHL